MNIIFLSEEDLLGFIEAQEPRKPHKDSNFTKLRLYIENCFKCYWTGASWSRDKSLAHLYLWDDLPKSITSQVTGKPIYLKYDLPIGTAIWYEADPLDHDSWVGIYEKDIKPETPWRPPPPMGEDLDEPRRMGP